MQEPKARQFDFMNMRRGPTAGRDPMTHLQLVTILPVSASRARLASQLAPDQSWTGQKQNVIEFH